MSDNFDTRRKEFQSRIFNREFEKWAKKIADETGKRGTSELFQFLMLTYKDNGELISENVWERFAEEKKRKETDADCYKVLRSNSVTHWKKGKTAISEKNIVIICKIFDISTRVFNFSLSDYGVLSYDVNEDARNEHEIELKDYCKKIELSTAFVEYITSLTDIDKIFPIDDEHSGHQSSGSIFEITDSTGESFYLNMTELDMLKELSDEIEKMTRNYLLIKWREQFETKLKNQIDTNLESLKFDKNISDADFENLKADVKSAFGVPEKSNILDRGTAPYWLGKRSYELGEFYFNKFYRTKKGYKSRKQKGNNHG